MASIFFCFKYDKVNTFSLLLIILLSNWKVQGLMVPICSEQLDNICADDEKNWEVGIWL